MAGKRQKPMSALAFQRAGRYRPLLTADEHEQPAPPCPDGLTAQAEAAWSRLWESRLSGVYVETDQPALYRWLWWYDQWLRTAEQLSQTGPTRRGSRGDVVLRSSVRYIRICEAALQSLEEALGLTPVARMRLGVMASQGPTAVESLRRHSEPQPMDRENDPRNWLREEGGGA